MSPTSPTPTGGASRSARALGSSPKMLLLDEPTAGMNDAETNEAVTYIRRLREKHGLTILLIEHKLTGDNGHVRPHRRPRLWPQDRRGHVRGDAATMNVSSRRTWDERRRWR